MTTTETAAVPAHTYPRDRRRELRVKIKSLAAEARIIRNEEQRVRESMTACVGKPEATAWLASSYASLRSHRVGDVRRESRYSQLAYAMLRGRTFERTEPKSDRCKIDARKLASLYARFACVTEAVAIAAVGGWLQPLTTQP